MKNKKATSPKAGDLIVMNELPDAAVFKIESVDGFRVGLTDAAIKENATMQWTDKSLLLIPTQEQLLQITA